MYTYCVHKIYNPPSPTLTLTLHVCDVILLFPFVQKNYDRTPIQKEDKLCNTEYNAPPRPRSLIPMVTNLSLAQELHSHQS